jgi:sec-independent protein translocase protein TatA
VSDHVSLEHSKAQTERYVGRRFRPPAALGQPEHHAVGSRARPTTARSSENLAKHLTPHYRHAIIRSIKRAINEATPVQLRRRQRMLGNIGTTELVLVLLIVLIIFGVGKLPQIGGALGTAIRDFRKVQKEVDSTIEEVKEDIAEVSESISEDKA